MTLKNELVPGGFYHIYNCGINGENIFQSHEDYSRFLRLYEKYINPVCDTYTWVLMKNHFHLMVRIKENIRYKYSSKDGNNDPEKFNEIKWETEEISALIVKSSIYTGPGQSKTNSKIISPFADHDESKVPRAFLHFSHFFNAYAKYFNIRYDRHGSLLERPFKRKKIDNSRYFQNVVVYIHQNPVHHRFCEHPMDYPWSSYLTCISLKTTSLKRDAVIGWFDNVGNFKTKHEQILNRRDIEDYLEL